MSEWALLFLLLIMFVGASVLVGKYIMKLWIKHKVTYLFQKTHYTFWHAYPLSVTNLKKPGQHRITGWGGEAYLSIFSEQSKELRVYPLFIDGFFTLHQDGLEESVEYYDQHGKMYIVLAKGSSDFFKRADKALAGHFLPVYRNNS